MTPEDRIGAAELALNLLEGEERATMLARVLAEPDIAEEVAWWRSRLAVMQTDYREKEPRAALIDWIEKRLTLVEPAAVAPRRRWPWIAGGAAAGAIAASMAAFMVLPPSGTPHPQTVPVTTGSPHLLVAALAPARGAGGRTAVAIIDRDARTIRLTSGIVVPEGRAAQLWRIGANGVPLAVGILNSAGSSRLVTGVATLPTESDTLAVSIEPKGGSETGAPTGPVVVTGEVTTT